MSPVIFGRSIVIELSLLAKPIPTRPRRTRIPVEVTDVLRSALHDTPAEDRPAVKRLLCKAFQLSTRQVDGIGAWDNGKLRAKRKKHS